MGVIRQTFQDCARFVNGLSSWLLSFFKRDYRETLRRSWEDNPWHSWWHHAQARPSTLNALIAAMQQQQQQQEPEGEWDPCAELAVPPLEWYQAAVPDWSLPSYSPCATPLLHPRLAVYSLQPVLPTLGALHTL